MTHSRGIGKTIATALLGAMLLPATPVFSDSKYMTMPVYADNANATYSQSTEQTQNEIDKLCNQYHNKQMVEEIFNYYHKINEKDAVEMTKYTLQYLDAKFNNDQYIMKLDNNVPDLSNSDFLNGFLRYMTKEQALNTTDAWRERMEHMQYYRSVDSVFNWMVGINYLTKNVGKGRDISYDELKKELTDKNIIIIGYFTENDLAAALNLRKIKDMTFLFLSSITTLKDIEEYLKGDEKAADEFRVRYPGVLETLKKEKIEGRNIKIILTRIPGYEEEFDEKYYLDEKDVYPTDHRIAEKAEEFIKTHKNETLTVIVRPFNVIPIKEILGKRKPEEAFIISPLNFRLPNDLPACIEHGEGNLVKYDSYIGPGGFLDFSKLLSK
ncbi:MAG: hypothetical protein HZB65_03975 [Candidatus Aenigmarchaeota archaeon]|nr:hypothetical protein [Candidatus Aenigmarchaeota archaeon]